MSKSEQPLKVEKNTEIWNLQFLFDAHLTQIENQSNFVNYATDF
jgi:hypothetical protein